MHLAKIKLRWNRSRWSSGDGVQQFMEITVDNLHVDVHVGYRERDSRDL